MRPDSPHSRRRQPRSAPKAAERAKHQGPEVRSGRRSCRASGEGSFDHISVPNVETFSSISAEIDLVLAKFGRVELLARGGRKRIEALHLLLVQAKHVRARFAKVAALGRYRDGLDGGGSYARDVILVRKPVAHLVCYLRVEVAGTF